MTTRLRRPFGLIAWLAPASCGPTFILPTAADEPAVVVAKVDRLPAVAVRLDLNSGAPRAGRLLEIDEAGVRLADGDDEAAVPLAAIRRLVRTDSPAAAAEQVMVTTVDGGEFRGERFVRVGDQAVLTVTGGDVTLPIDRVSRVAWPAAGTGWQDALPERPTSDVLAVRRDEGHELVECAVTGIDAEHVTIRLDGETIPVKRSKVAGIAWLRPEAGPAGGTLVAVTGGRAVARVIRWSAAGLVLDDTVRLPADLLRSIDYAAGRTVPLADLEPEHTDVEPFFGGLARIEGIEGFFTPRVVPDPDVPPTVVLRPRTAATWRVPAESRRFRAAIERDVASGEAAVEVRIALDDRELFRQTINAGAAAIPVDLELTDGRRLTLVVDFVAGDMGCGVRLVAPAFEK